MRGIKLELLGIGVMLLAFALGSNNAIAFFGAPIGFCVLLIGCFWKEKNS